MRTSPWALGKVAEEINVAADERVKDDDEAEKDNADCTQSSQ